MKNFKHCNLLIALLAGAILLLPSCDIMGGDELLNRSPRDTPSPDNFFVNETSAAQAVAAIYSDIAVYGTMYGRDWELLLDAMSDDGGWRPSAGATELNLYEWNITPDNFEVYRAFRQTYRSINAANWAIENIPILLEKGLSQEEIDPYIGEARFMRAFNYLFLTSFWGDVPLITTPLASFEEFEQPKSPSAEIYDQIVSDFTSARDNLPEEWPSDRLGAPTKAAAAAYIAKAELYRENYEAAETAARTAIQIAESTGYALADDYQSIFDAANQPNPELLFYISFVASDPVQSNKASIKRISRDIPAELYHVWGAAGWGYHLPQRDLYDAYEAGDPRRDYTIYAPGDFYGIYSGDQPFTYEHQTYDQNGDIVTYEVTYTDGDSIEYDMRWSPTGMNTRKGLENVTNLANVRWGGYDVPLLRMADLYLFLAEALAEQGDPEALDWVNAVRSRASVNMPDKTTADGNLVDLVRHERRVELAMEGQRIFDLLRWREMKNVFGNGTKVKRHFFSDFLPPEEDYTKFNAIQLDNYPNDRILFPIPQNELDQNSKLEQNPGY